MKVSIVIDGKEHEFINDSKVNKNTKTYNERVLEITNKGKWGAALQMKDGTVEYYNL